MDRAQLLRKIDETYDARAKGDKETVSGYLAPGSRYQLAGDTSLLSGFPVGPEEAPKAISTLIDRVQFQQYERLSAIVEANSAAVRWRVTLSVDGKPPVTTEICDLWEFDEDGRMTSLVEFIDTALLRKLLTT